MKLLKISKKNTIKYLCQQYWYTLLCTKTPEMDLNNQNNNVQISLSFNYKLFDQNKWMHYYLSVHKLGNIQ